MATDTGIVGTLVENPEYADILESALELEKSGGTGPPWKKGWTFSDIRAKPGTLTQMVQAGLLDVEKRPSNDPNQYSLVNPDEVEQGLTLLEEGGEPHTDDVGDSDSNQDIEVPDDMFDKVIGHDPIKDLMMRGIQTEDQTHFRLQGESSTAKSLFLTEMERLPNSKYRSASGMTEAGLLDILMDQQPRYLLFDEIDKADKECYTPLYELTEHGRVQKTISGKEVNIELNCNLVVTLNHPEQLPEELRKRMVKLEFEEYDDKEYIEVVSGVLQDHYDLDDGVAMFIAKYHLEELGEKNVREPEQIAKLADNTKEDVKRVIEQIEEYR